MNASDAYAALKSLGAVVVSTSDAAATWRQSPPTAAQTLLRLARAGLVRRIRRGLFWVDGPIDPYRLPQYLTAPLESYVSLQSALSLRGLIEQIPHTVYAVSLARTQRIATRAGMFSIHHIEPELFGGYDELESGVRLATAEKALFDFAYFSTARSRLFTALPELELPPKLSRAEIKHWIAKVRSQRHRTITRGKLESFGAL